jgi:hypothetical protein
VTQDDLLYRFRLRTVDRAVARQICHLLNNGLLAQGYQACVEAET